MTVQPKLTRFKEQVLSKFQIYNSIFMTLPFDAVTKTGVLLPLFHETCQKGFAQGEDPTTIVETFFRKYQARRSPQSQINLLFRFIQYIERQVVLFDAIEDAAFPVVNNMDGIGTLRSLKESAISSNQLDVLRKHLEDFKIRIVLTAHPTQFYPGTVLGIITDLTQALRNNDLRRIKELMAQLGKTPFFKKQKPTPYDEAISLIWYLENVFYHSGARIYAYIRETIYNGKRPKNEVVNIGFWPGGDRDGNPFVTPEITMRVAQRLKLTILRNYYRDARKLRRMLTFQGVYEKIIDLETMLYQSFTNVKYDQLTLDLLHSELHAIRKMLIDKHESLYIEEVERLIDKVSLFGFHFAHLDIRQDSRIHARVFDELVNHCLDSGNGIFPDDYKRMEESKQLQVLSEISGSINCNEFDDDLTRQTLETMEKIKAIQDENGEAACHRYIISNNQTAINVLQVLAMLRLTAFKENVTVDIVPLFETIDDLTNALGVMETLYTNAGYMKHLKSRGRKQTIMLGFSDGTKDGGYLMANWAIFKAKEQLTAVSEKYGIDVVFFDGRGGPPARGGGKTNQFYASLGPTIADNEIQLTIQGQTISSNFGTLESSQYNLEQLISAGLSNKLGQESLALTAEHKELINDLAERSYEAYQRFKGHDKFIPYLEKMSTLKYYALTNIGSRPSKRSNSDKLVFSDLRAIPFVGSWSQLKQNVPGFFGVGTALGYYEEIGEFDKVKSLYENSKFFKTLLANSMMSLSKSFFPLTAYMAKDPEFGEFWTMIHEEFQNTKRLLLKLSGFKTLMENEAAGKASIEIRESIVLPLLTIQQYGLKRIQELQEEPEKNKAQIEIFEKIVTRSLFGNINASRNSA